MNFWPNQHTDRRQVQQSGKVYTEGSPIFGKFYSQDCPIQSNMIPGAECQYAGEHTTPTNCHFAVA